MYYHMMYQIRYFAFSFKLAIVLYCIYSFILFITKKRDKRYIPCKTMMFFEFSLIAYICAILEVTGILGMRFHFNLSIYTFAYLFKIPFVGASIRMILLNVFLFVPYGFLVPIVFSSNKLNWKYAFLVGFGSTLGIETLQVFSGRLCEIDDLIANTCGFLIGFFVYKAFQKLFQKETRKKGLAQLIYIGGITIASLFLISLFAIGSICEYRIYNKDEVFDALQEESANYEM